MAFITNEFYRLDGLKFSTSRAHAIWLLEVLDSVAADHLRIYLSWDRPAVSQTNFRWKDFDTRIYGDLLPRWHKWLNSLGRRSAMAVSWEKYARGAIPCSPATGSLHEKWIKNALKRSHEAYSAEQFSPRTALQQLDLLAQAASEAGTDSEHLATHTRLQAEFVTEVRRELAVAASFSMGIYPIAPTMASQLWRMLGCVDRVDRAQWDRPDAYLPDSLASVDLGNVGSVFAPVTRALSHDRNEELVQPDPDRA